ncbi:MAG: hypothetical protein R2834_17390 [Rhodothermales bacterium]
MSDTSFKQREMPALDKIHILFLLYSGAHNCINAFARAHNIVFFVFVVVGILSVELMLWAVYNHWKDGRLIGPMLRVSLWAGFFAMFYATAGILAQAQSGGASDWIQLYYAWILPTSAPCMFVFAFLIQSVDPITNADRAAVAHEHQTHVEEKREVLDRKQLALDNRRNIRRLKAHVQHQRMDMLWKESMSRRTRNLLRKSGRIELPYLLKSIGVPVERANRMKTNWLGLGSSSMPLLSMGGDGDGRMKDVVENDGGLFPDHGALEMTPNANAVEVRKSGGRADRRSGNGNRVCKWHECGAPLTGRRKDYCSDRCKQASYRARKANAGV